MKSHSTANWPMVDFGGKNYHLWMDKSEYDEEDISDVTKTKT